MGCSNISNQNYFRIPQRGQVRYFPTNHPSRFPSRGASKISNQTSFHITQKRFYSKNLPGNLHFPTQAHIQLLSKQNYITIPLLHTFYRNTPRVTPSTHPAYHPSCSLTNTTRNCPTPTQYHELGFTRIPWRPHGSHSTFQY